VPDTARLVQRIIDRRRDNHDDDRHRLGDDDQDALAAVRYVRAYRRVPPGVLKADVEDALAITERLRAEVNAEQEALIRMARAAPIHLTWQRIANALGMGSRQGAVDRLRRIQGAKQGKTDVEARGDRSVHRRRATWLAGGDRADRVRELAAGWLSVRDLVPAAWTEDLDDLGEYADAEALAIAVRDLGRQLDAVGGVDQPVAEMIARTRSLLDGFPSARLPRG
jgi:hypothetical protein